MIGLSFLAPLGTHRQAPAAGGPGPAVPGPAGRRPSRIVSAGAVLLLATLPAFPLGAAERTARPADPNPASGREDTASLIFQKTVETRKTQVHVVQKGEHIAAIFRAQWGDEPVPYALIRQLNPQLKDLNKVFPGQKIVLPLRGLLSQRGATEPQQRRDSPSRHLIQEGDSVSRILLADWDTRPDQFLRTYRQLRQLNPHIEDLNRLPVGRWLQLPPGLLGRAAPPEAPLQTAAQASAPATGPVPAGPPAPASPSAPAGPAAATVPGPPAVTTAAPAAVPAVPAAAPSVAPAVPAAAPRQEEGPGSALAVAREREPVLALIGSVLSRMKGSLTSQGHYFIPLKEGAQITIDCSLIPVVDLEDGTTALLDFGDRLAGTASGMIRQSWPQTAIVPAGDLKDGLAGLQGVIRRSRNYQMTRTEKPLALNPGQTILVYPDWLITVRKPLGDRAYRQCLFLRTPEESPLPPEVRWLLEKNGLVVTEIAAGRVVEALPAAPPGRPTLIDLRGRKGLALAEPLLKALGERPAAASEIPVFEQARDGFNLSVTADLLLSGERRLLIHGKRLPDQFVQRLRQDGTEILFIGPDEAGRALIEKLLQAVRLPFSTGHFSFRIPPDGLRPRLTTAFSSLRVNRGNDPVYLFDRDLSEELVALLQSRQAGTIILY